MRTLTTAVSNEADAGVVRPFIAVELNFASGFVRLWSGIGDISFGGNIYHGSGDLGNISEIKESAGFVANGVSMSLSGIPSQLLATALLEKYQGRRATIWLGFFNTSNAIIPDPFQVFSGRMDTMAIQEGGETSTITVQAESRALALKRSNERRWTHEEQQLDHPGDRGFEYMSSLQDANIIWRPA